MASRVQLYRARDRENLRSKIPLEVLLRINYIAAATGKMPQVDEHGLATGTYDMVSGAERIRIAQHLIDKALPSAPADPTALPEEAPPPEELEAMTANDFSKLSDEELKRIAYGNDTGT
jgi:hypothetical protein